MSTTARLSRIDDGGRRVYDAPQADALGLDEDGYLDLDVEWGALQTMIGSVSAVDPFTDESLDADAVRRLAAVLRLLPWKKAVETCEVPEDVEVEDLRPAFKSLRALVMSAAEEGHGLACEFC